MIDTFLRRTLSILTAVVLILLCVLCIVTIQQMHDQAVAAREEAEYWADYAFFNSPDDDPDVCYALWYNIADQDPEKIDSYGLYVYVDTPEDLALIYNNFLVLTYDSNPLSTLDDLYKQDDEEPSVHDYLATIASATP